MYEILADFLNKWKMSDCEVAIYVASGHEYLEKIALGYIFKVTPDYIALVDEKDSYNQLVVMDKIVRIEIIGTPDDN